MTYTTLTHLKLDRFATAVLTPNLFLEVLKKFKRQKILSLPLDSVGNTERKHLVSDYF